MIGETSTCVSTADLTPGSKKASSDNSDLFVKHVFMLVLTVLVIVMSIAFGVQIEQIQTMKEGSKSNAIVGDEPKVTKFRDCKDALSQGNNVSGLFEIQPNAFTSPFQVYCDMVSNGGGWTMVASIHEDIGSSDSSMNMWLKPTSSGVALLNNWVNLKSFGTLEAVLTEEYKNKGLYALNASDIMVWHMSKYVPLSAISSGARLKYHTSNGFLQKYGSNLHTLFGQYFPLTRSMVQNVAGNLIGCAQNGQWRDVWMDRWDQVGPVNPVPINHSDKITITFDSQTKIEINQTGTYSISEGMTVEAATQKTANVSTTLVWLPMPSTVRKLLQIRIDLAYIGSNPAYQHGSFYTGVYEKDYMGKLGALCTGPYCNVIYVITHATHWGKLTTRDRQQTTISRSQNDTAIIADITNMNSATLVGYTVFQREYYTNPSIYYWNRVFLTDILPCFDNVHISKVNNLPSLSVPASFNIGETGSKKSYKTTGHINFRKYDNAGYPYPICPAISSKYGALPPSTGEKGNASSFSYIFEQSCDNSGVSANTNGLSNWSEFLTSTMLLFYR